MSRPLSEQFEAVLKLRDDWHAANVTMWQAEAAFDKAQREKIIAERNNERTLGACNHAEKALKKAIADLEITKAETAE